MAFHSRTSVSQVTTGIWYWLEIVVNQEYSTEKVGGRGSNCTFKGLEDLDYKVSSVHLFQSMQDLADKLHGRIHWDIWSLLGFKRNILQATFSSSQQTWPSDLTSQKHIKDSREWTRSNSQMRLVSGPEELKKSLYSIFFCYSYSVLQGRITSLREKFISPLLIENLLELKLSDAVIFLSLKVSLAKYCPSPKFWRSFD